MVTHRVLMEPFESVAVDLVGPLPKGKGGMRWILTYVCMASRWPDVVTLRETSVKPVANGLIQIFSRMALSFLMLSDRGGQFMGSVMRELCALLSIEKFQTTAYHPQCNGMVEHMHAILESMLVKAHALGQDWVLQLPLAMFAFRQAPNRDMGLSPYTLVFGRNVRTPLELFYHGWVGEYYTPLDVATWIECIQEKMDLARVVAAEWFEAT